MLRKNRSSQSNVETNSALLNTSSRKNGVLTASREAFHSFNHLQQQQQLEEERFLNLKGNRKAITRDQLSDSLKIQLTPFFLNRFFETLHVGTEVDLQAFQRITRVLERHSLAERQEVVFSMFDPQGGGRVRKMEFKKVALELMRGSTSTVSAPAASSSVDSSVKAVVQTFTDAAYLIYCADEMKGMDFKEWLNFANEDVETKRLLGALDHRIQWDAVAIKRRLKIAGN